METLKFKPMELLLMAILILSLSSCDIIQKVGECLFCNEEETPWIDDQPYEIQALNCGGAADVFGLFDFPNTQLYTDTSGNKVYYNRFVFTDVDGNQMFTTKFADYNLLPQNTEGFIVDYSDPNRVKYYRIQVKAIQDTSDPNIKIYLCHQFKECPGINGDCNFAPNSYPGTPVKLIACEGDFTIGQDLGLVIQIPTA